MNQRISVSVLFFVFAFTSVGLFAQTRRRIPKPKPSKTESQAEKKGATKQQKAAEPEYLPSAFEAIPKPPDRSQWCSLAWQQAPDLAGVKLGMRKDQVLAMANNSAFKTSMPNFDWGRLLEYYNVSEALLQHPLPQFSELSEMVERNNRIAGGERLPPKPVRPAPPRLRVKDEGTGTELTNIHFGFSNEMLLHVRAAYRSRVQWDWEDLQVMFLRQGIPTNSWVRHTNIPTTRLDRSIQETLGLKRYKQTAYCEGFFLTVTYGGGKSADWFVLDLIHYPTLVGAYKSWQQVQEQQKGRFRP